MNRHRAAAALLVAVSVTLSACGARQSEPATPEPVGVHDEDPVDDSTDTDSAVDKAVGFVTSGQRLLDTSPAGLAEKVRSLWSAASADGALETTLNRLSALRARLGSGTGRTRFRQAVLGVRVDSAAAERVVVSVWWVGVLSRADVITPQAQWSTSTLTMVSEDGDWKVDAETTEPGPLPDHSVDSEPITHAELERRLTGFVDWADR